MTFREPPQPRFPPMRVRPETPYIGQVRAHEAAQRAEKLPAVESAEPRHRLPSTPPVAPTHASYVASQRRRMLGSFLIGAIIAGLLLVAVFLAAGLRA